MPKAAVSNRSKQHRYSITSSARASSDGGTSRPSAFLMLKTCECGIDLAVGAGVEI